VQEMAALTVSKMPVNEASAVIERLTGVKLPPATLDWEARRQGRRADKKRAQLDEQMRTAQGVPQMLPQPQQPFTLVIETGRLEYPRTRRLGSQRHPARRWPGAVPLALGLWRHLFSYGPAR
jgi:hypothetical protein